MAAILTAVSQVATAVIGMVGDWLALFTAEGNEVLLLFCIAIPLVGIGIGALTRLLRTRG